MSSLPPRLTMGSHKSAGFYQLDLRDIPGYEGVYAADADGHIYRTERYGRVICRKIALRRKNGGYLVAHLCKDAVRKDVSAHRAVWMAFSGPIAEGLEINHKNGIRHDNRLANLEVVTRSGNALHKFRINGYRKSDAPSPGILNGAAKLSEDDVRQIRALADTGLFQKEIGKQFGISQVMAGKIIRRENWRHVD